MQEALIIQAGATEAARTSMREYLSEALTQTELLRGMLRGLQQGNELSLAAWEEAFEASQRTVDHINKAMTLAQEVFESHVVQVSGALSEGMRCDEFACLTWQ